jgi:hypothetical protein
MNSSFGRNEGGFNLPWGGSKYNDKKLTPWSKYHKENWTQGQNIIGKSTPGSIYHGVQNTIWHRISKRHVFKIPTLGNTFSLYKLEWRLENLSSVIQPLIHIIFNCINFSVAMIKLTLNIAIPEYQFWPFTPRVYTVDITEIKFSNLYSAW